MTLSEFFAALQNDNMVVTIQEPGSGEAVDTLAKIFVPGYEQLQSTLLARIVDKINIKSNGEAVVLLTAGA